MPSNKSKSKQKSGPAKPAFASMPGHAATSPAGARISPNPLTPTTLASPVHRHWLAPGEAVAVQSIQILGGMFYFGSSLPALDGSEIEPSLVNPNLRIAEPNVRGVDRDSRYFPEYRNFTSVERRDYLRWLAGGRTDATVTPKFPYLFFSGLERRLIAPFVLGQRVRNIESPLTPDERIALRAEILRLGNSQPYANLAAHCNNLMALVDLSTVLNDPDSIYTFNAESLSFWPQRADGVLPTAAVRLARFAVDQKPITADWAWTWFRLDPESDLEDYSPQLLNTARRIFPQMFQRVAPPGGIRLTLTGTPIVAHYAPVSPSYQRRVEMITAADARRIPWLQQVNPEPLRLIRQAAFAAIAEAKSAHRVVNRPHYGRGLATVARLTDRYFINHPLVNDFRDWLNQHIAPEPDSPAIMPAGRLIARWQNHNEPSHITKSEVISLLATLDRLGFEAEPDVRLGGPTLSVGKDGDAVIAIARRGPNNDSDNALSPIVYRVGLPLIVRAARAAGNTDLSSLIPFAEALPSATAADPTRIAVRLAWLLASAKESARLPKPSEPTLAALDASDRTRIADILTATAAFSGPVSPAAVAELIRLFALLGLPDTEVYSRLHDTASTGNIRAKSATTTAKSTPKATKNTTRVTIDPEVVKRKTAESEHVSTLLADIFTEETQSLPAHLPVAPLPSDVPVFATQAPSTALDPRHTDFLRALLSQDTWPLADLTALARTANLMPNAAIETINEAAYDRFEEPILEGDDPIYIQLDLANDLLS